MDRLSIALRSHEIEPISHLSALSVIPIEPMRRGGRNILDGMADLFGNEHLVARFRDDVFFIDDQPEFSRHNGHELVCGMDEAIPLASGWVDEYITGVAPPAPVSSHLVTVDRHREFITGEIGHESKVWAPIPIRRSCVPSLKHGPLYRDEAAT